jgi:hypothetical protein
VRQKIGDPHEQAAVSSLREHLSGRVVMCILRVRDRPREPPRVVIEVYQPLAQHAAVEEGDDSVITVQPSIGREAGHEPHVQRSPITQRIPNAIRTRADRDLLANRSHRSVILSWLGR